MAFESKTSSLEKQEDALEEIIEYYKHVGLYDKLCSIVFVKYEEGLHYFSIHMND